ncbi:MAG: hypothetical protein LBU32_10435 [Clostridiales bacterium]|nr:hypothetical protein [Clostridiales bacterium]
MFLALHVISSAMTSANGLLISMLIPDCLEYGTYHTGDRAEGVESSIQTFVVKLSSSI